MMTKTKTKVKQLWINAFHDGYFFNFREMHVNVRIEREKEGEPRVSTLILCAGKRNGNLDITRVCKEYNKQVKEYSDYHIKVVLTGFIRRVKFDKKLLSTPMPKCLLDLFSKK